MDDLVENRCSDLNTAISCLSLLSAHDALTEDVVKRTKDATHIALFTMRQPPMSRDVQQPA